MSAAPTYPSARASGDEAPQTRRDEGNIRNRILRLLPPAELDAVLERTEMMTIESKEKVW